MSKSKKRVLTEAGVTRETLEQTPARVLTFLMGVATTPTIRSLLRVRGYDKAEHKRGWALLEALGHRELITSHTDEEVADAIAEIDNWDEPNIRLIRAGLTRHPNERDQVLDGITPATGIAAVPNVATILDRLDALSETAEGRAALKTLAARGLDEAERKRVAALVKLVTSGGPQLSDNHAVAEREAAHVDADEAFVQALLELREWHDEWSEIARLALKRRDHQIRVGIAERRTSGGATDAVADPTPFLKDPEKSGGSPAKG
jgi:hypothetical protein